jgi:uncharacterized membrane protein YtjA (UPF0391 family)
MLGIKSKGIRVVGVVAGKEAYIAQIVHYFPVVILSALLYVFLCQ